MYECLSDHKLIVDGKDLGKISAYPWILLYTVGIIYILQEHSLINLYFFKN